MPEGWLLVVALLVTGYLLLLFELFVPGGVVGVLGALVVAFGCWRAFQLGTGWGTAALVLSVLLTGGGLAAFHRSPAGRSLVLDNTGSREWKAPDGALAALLGREGTALTDLRPAGTAEFDDRRVDVVAEAEYLDRGARVRVSRVEGGRVVVEPVGEAAAGT